MAAGRKGYFLLDAVLAMLILSILMSAILLSLETSLKALRKVNSDLISLYRVEDVLVKKLILEDDFENSGYADRDKEISYLIKSEYLEKDISKISVSIKRDSKTQAQLSTLALN